MSEKFSIAKAHESFAQLARMELIETGNIEITTPNGVIEYSVKMIVGARVRNGVIVEIDFAVNGNTHTVKDIERILVNGQISDLIALFEYNMNDETINNTTSYTQIKPS